MEKCCSKWRDAFLMYELLCLAARLACSKTFNFGNFLVLLEIDAKLSCGKIYIVLNR